MKLSELVLLAAGNLEVDVLIRDPLDTGWTMPVDEAFTTHGTNRPDIVSHVILVSHELEKRPLDKKQLEYYAAKLSQDDPRR